MNSDKAIFLFLPDPESPSFSGGVHGRAWIGVSPLRSLDSSDTDSLLFHCWHFGQAVALQL